MFPPRVPTFEVYAGDDFSETIRFQEQGASVDLSEWSDWQAEWRGGELQESFTVDATQARSGLIALSLTPDQTRVMQPAGTWDLQATRPGEVKTWAAGSTLWRIDVTGRP